MSTKNTIVSFGPAGGRIRKGPGVPGANELLNPVFPKGVPPHLWVKDGDKIAVITQSEWGRRNPSIPASKPKKRRNWSSPLAWMLLGAVLGGLVSHLLMRVM